MKLSTGLGLRRKILEGNGIQLTFACNNLKRNFGRSKHTGRQDGYAVVIAPLHCKIPFKHAEHQITREFPPEGPFCLFCFVLKEIKVGPKIISYLYRFISERVNKLVSPILCELHHIRTLCLRGKSVPCIG